jgi:hypothetical protein
MLSYFFQIVLSDTLITCFSMLWMYIVGTLYNYACAFIKVNQFMIVHNHLQEIFKSMFTLPSILINRTSLLIYPFIIHIISLSLSLSGMTYFLLKILVSKILRPLNIGSSMHSWHYSVRKHTSFLTALLLKKSYHAFKYI